MKFRFVHAADLHLDTPFEGIAKADGRVAESLREASLRAFEGLVQLAIDRRAEILLLAGDIYDGPERGVRAQLALLRGVRRLCAAGVEVFLVRGNHDHEGGWEHIRDWPPGFHEMPPGEVRSIPVQRNGRLLATVHGISYDRRDVTENLAARFPRPSGPGLHVGLLHCNVGGNAEHASYSPCSLDDLRGAGMGYWALGHIHRHQVLAERNPWIVYPGSLQGRSSKPSEQGPKGAVVVEVDDGRVGGVEFVPLDHIRFVGLQVDVAEIDDLVALEDALRDEAERLRTDNPGRGLLIRAELRGCGPVHVDLRPEGALDQFLTKLRQDHEGASPFLWWETLRDGTRSAIDLDAIRKSQSDFRAEVVRAADALRADPAAHAAWAEQRLEKSLRKALGGAQQEGADEILGDAVMRALELLEDGGE